MSHRLRTHCLVLVLFVLVIALPAWAAAQDTAPKIAVVDIDQVVVSSKAGQALQTRLQTLEQETQAKLEEATQLIQNLQQSLQGKDAATAREIQKQIEDATLRGRRQREDAERQAQKIQQEELQRIRDSLRPVFEKIQTESAYDLILNYNPAIVIAVSETIDITDRVLQMLDGGGG